MKIDRVKVLEIDDSLKMLQPARTMEIRTDRGSTVTPNRCVTSYEFNRKAEVPASVPISNQVSVYGKRLTGRDVTDLLTTNTWLRGQIRRLEKANRVAAYSVLHVPAFEIARTCSTGPAPMDTLSAEKNLAKFMRLLISMQDEAGCGVISVPHLDLPLGSLKKTLSDAAEAIAKLGRQPLFSADLGYGKFPQILDYLVDDLQSDMIALNHRKRRDFPQHYDGMGSLARKDVAFLMTGIDRMDAEHGDLSTMHYMPFFGNDLMAVETPPPAIAPSDKPKNPANLKALDRDELVLLPVTDDRVSEKNILDRAWDQMPADLRHDISHIDEIRRDPKKYSIINSMTRLQELITSTDEFSALTAHVRERSARDYVASKKNLGQRLVDV